MTARAVQRCLGMMDTRIAQLEQLLLDAGWSADRDALIAPHATMAIGPSRELPNFDTFRAAMADAVEASELDGEIELHDDLVSLVSALDVVLDGN